MAKAAFQARVYGQVQGVGYRFFVEDKAFLYGVTGYVKNLPDGSVEVYAEGEREVLEQLLADLNQGPPAARVTHVEVDWKLPTGKYQEFSIAF
ncbi:MAG: acylphosphatase [Calditrichaeota bacterium]|nr:MAG: acylphosphatase [Calditrichota bacterium]